MARKLPAKDLVVKLIVGAGQASPSPPVGPALGSKGVKSMDFCKEFNALTSQMHPGTPIPCLITVRPDRSFSFIIRTPPTSTLLLSAATGGTLAEAAKIRGANAPGRPSIIDPLTVQSSPSTPSTPTANEEPGSVVVGAEGEGVGVGVKRLVDRSKGGDKGPGHGGGVAQVGEISLKHVYEIARIKQSEPRLAGLSLEGLCKSVIAQARSVGVGVVP